MSALEELGDAPRAIRETSLGVVILTHGASRMSLDLARILADSVPPEAIVIVQNPTRADDPTPEPEECGVRVLRMDRNAGYAAGMNAGIRYHLERNVDFVLTLTHEVRFRPGALAKLVHAALRSSQYGVLGPVLWWRDADQPLSFGGRRRSRGGLEHAQTRPAANDGIAPSDWIDGAAMLFRTAALERAGLLEERFFIYVEDAEICLRISKSGFEVGVVLDALADASPGADTRPGAWLYLSTRNGLEYARRAQGVRGVMWELARCMKKSFGIVRVCLRRGTDRNRRERHRLELQAIRRGAFDFFRRRWGPPPATLAGTGDLRGTAAESLDR